MKKKCFSCQQGQNKTVLSSLELHKNIYETTGKAYWFFKENKDGQTKIASNDSFKIIYERIKNNPGAEWAHIAEFGQPANDNVPKNTQYPRPKASTSKIKPKKS